MGRTFGLLVPMVGFVLAISLSGSPPRYTVTDLGPIPGISQSFAVAVNEAGTVAGSSGGPVRWTGPAAEELGTFPGASLTGGARDINATGTITGAADDETGNQVAFVWTTGTGMVSLGTLPGDTQSNGHGLNDDGWVTGFSADQGVTTAFVWDGTTMTSIGTLPGGTRSIGYAINNAGWITGTSDQQAMIWDGTAMTGLGFLPGTARSNGSDINSSGWVAGTSSGPGSNDEAFLWDGTSMIGLGFLEGDNRSDGEGLNDVGWVVGASIGTGPVTRNGRAFVWDGSEMHDLNTLVEGPNPFSTLRAANDISNSGLIVGVGALPSGLDHGFLLTPLDADDPVLVTIDIIPGKEPNRIRLFSRAVPVAILTTDTFDATTVDPASVTLAGASVYMKGDGQTAGSQQDVDGDGDVDLVVYVSAQQLALTPDDTEAVLTGTTFDGTMIQGTDTVRVVP